MCQHGSPVILRVIRHRRQEEASASEFIPISGHMQRMVQPVGWGGGMPKPGCHMVATGPRRKHHQQQAAAPTRHTQTSSMPCIAQHTTPIHTTLNHASQTHTPQPSEPHIGTQTQRQQHRCDDMPGNPAPVGLGRRAALIAAGSAALLPLPLSGQAAAAPAPAVARPFCGVVSSIPPWAFSANWEEGTISYAGFQTWYRALGQRPPERRRRARGFQAQEADKLPLLVLHGGPGTPSRYLESLELLGVTNRRVIFYDQVGCGQSRVASEGKGPAASRLTPQLFIEEVEAVRRALGLERVHLLGHGWGGMLALACLTQGLPLTPTSSGQSSEQSSKQSSGQEGAGVPALLAAQGVASLTLLATPPSWEALINDRRKKGQALGADAWSALQQEDNSPAYLDALRRYRQAHVSCQQPVLPGCLNISLAAASPSVSKAMAGGKTFTAEGALASWPVIGDNPAALSGLPTLVVRGAREELSPASTEQLLKGPLAGAATQLLELPGAGTMMHIDAHEALLEALDAHLMAADTRLL